MDDYLYTLWHNKEIRNTLDKLGKEFEVFYFSIGDCDQSLEFVYYKNKKLVRKFIFEDSHHEGGEILANIGTPFECEKGCLNSKISFNEPNEKVKPIMKFIGIGLSYKTTKIKCYKQKEKGEIKI